MGEGINIFRKDKGRGVLAETKESKFRQAYSRSEKNVTIQIRAYQGKSFIMKSKRKQSKVDITKDTIDHVLNDIHERRLPISKKDIPRVLEPKYEGYSDADRAGKHKKDAHIQGFKYFSFTYNGITLYFNVAHKRKEVNGRNVYVDEMYCITKEIKK